MKRPIRRQTENVSMEGNILVSGKWDYINSYGEETGEKLRFVVSYIDTSGKARKAYSLTAFSHDIRDAVLMRGKYD